MLKFLDVNKFVKGLTPVTTTELKTRTGELHQDGLFSEKIFGIEGTLDRGKKFSFINLNAKVIHPSAYKILIRLNSKLETFFSTEKSFSLDSKQNLIVNEKGVTGLSNFIKMFPDINFKGETSTRDDLIKVMQKSYNDGTLFVDKIPIVPPNFRPMFEDEQGKVTLDELNNVYIGLMRKALQMKSIKPGNSLYELLNFGLQNAINAHDKYIKTKIAKKTGIVRDSLLGKRIDFSERAVITPGPDLDINEIGVPLRMAVNLFQPFLIHILLFSKKYPHRGKLEDEIRKFTESELSVDTVERVIKSIKSGDKIPKELYDLIFEACEVVMKDRVVIAKRDPALHDGSYSAFYPILVHGDTMQICTLQVTPFNADFDGDTMALFHPLTKQAQQEAKDKLMRAVGSKNDRSIRFDIGKEMVAGLYTMTKNIKLKKSPIAVTPTDLENANDPYIPVRFRGHSTTMGKAIFNSAFPPNFKWIDVPVTKSIVNKLAPELIAKYDEDVTRKVFSKLEKIGFKFATIMAPSFTLDMIEIPQTILRLKDKLIGSSPEEADTLLKEMEKLLIKHLKGTGVYDLIESGAGKGWSQPMQILVAKGIIADPKGKLLEPIKGSFSDGLSTTEYFTAASGARKGMADRALNTADTGYFTRQLVYVLSPVEAHPTLRDCKTPRTIELRLTSDLITRLSGRVIVYGGKLKDFKKSDFTVGDTIKLRTPIFCISKKICHTCYGSLLKRHKTPYVGVLAGSAIGERGTQLIMRTFHTGGAATIKKQDILQDVIDNDPLIQMDKKALTKYINQDEDKLISTQPATITIDLANYKVNDTLQITDEKTVWVNHLLAKIEFKNSIFNLMLDYPVELEAGQMKKIGKDKIELSYSQNNVILVVPLQTVEMKEQVNYVNRLLGGKVVYKDPSHLLLKIMKVYGGSISDMDLVHFEILASQVLRDKKNHVLPARLGKTWDPVMMNIKNDVFASGFIQGLAFENIGKAIETGLIAKEEIDPSIMGRIMTGDLK